MRQTACDTQCGSMKALFANRLLGSARCSLTNDLAGQVRQSLEIASSETHRRLPQLAGQRGRLGEAQKHSPASLRPLPVEKCHLNLNVTQEGVMVHLALSLEESGLLWMHSRAWEVFILTIHSKDVQP